MGNTGQANQAQMNETLYHQMVGFFMQANSFDLEFWQLQHSVQQAKCCFRWNPVFVIWFCPSLKISLISADSLGHVGDTLSRSVVSSIILCQNLSNMPWKKKIIMTLVLNSFPGLINLLSLWLIIANVANIVTKLLSLHTTSSVSVHPAFSAITLWLRWTIRIANCLLDSTSVETIKLLLELTCPDLIERKPYSPFITQSIDVSYSLCWGKCVQKLERKRGESHAR